MKTLWYLWCGKWHQEYWVWAGFHRLSRGCLHHVYKCNRCGARWVKP